MQTKFAKVMFSQVSVCPRRGGRGVSVWGISVQGSLCLEGLCPGGSLSGVLCPGGLSGRIPVWGVSVQGVCVRGASLFRGVSVMETPVTCGRYASYWNAFLFLLCLYKYNKRLILHSHCSKDNELHSAETWCSRRVKKTV